MSDIVHCVCAFCFTCFRGAVDAVGVLMTEVQQAAALCMDVAAAFPSVARECLMRKMRTMGLDENLVG